MHRPTVLFMNRVYPPVRGATGRVLRDLARTFAREGWQVTVITTGPKSLVERDGAVKVIRIKAPETPSNTLSYLWIWTRMLIKALRLPATHLLVTMTDPPLLVIAGQWIKRIKKNHHIHWCQDLYPDILPSLGSKIPKLFFKTLHSLSRRAMKTTDKVIVIGRCMARHLSQDGFDPKQITVIPNWPDFELTRPEGRKDFNGQALNPQKIENRQDEEDQEDNTEGKIARNHIDQVKYGPKFRVLYAGNIGKAHPIDTIIEAAKQLNQDNTDIEFVFVGDGPRFDEIAAARAKNHLDNIRLLPFQPANRLKELMESGDIHLISMEERAAGMIVPSKLYAALAAQRPSILIGPAHSEVAKVINDFKAGSVIPQGQAETLANDILQYRHNSDKWFKAHEGAANAAHIFVPRESINAFIERAWSVVKQDIDL